MIIGQEDSKTNVLSRRDKDAPYRTLSHLIGLGRVLSLNTFTEHNTSTFDTFSVTTLV